MNRRYFLSLITLLLGLAACAGKPVAPSAPAAISPQILATQFGFSVIRDRQLESYLASLGTRIQAAGSVGALEKFSVAAVDTQTPLALSTLGGSTIISLGLLRRLQNEAELVFILAHEYGHHILKHTTSSQEEISTIEAQNRELAADRWAVSILARLGYDPRIAFSALQRCYQALNLPMNGGINGYPDLSSRLAVVDGEIQRLRMNPMGTRTWGMVNTRQFQKLKEYLGAEEVTPPAE